MMLLCRSTYHGEWMAKRKRKADSTLVFDNESAMWIKKCHLQLKFRSFVGLHHLEIV